MALAVAGASVPLEAVPSFARQTGLACQACHTVFPELTPFGRRFKLNGYQIDNIKQVQSITPAEDATLLLNEIPPLSFMLEVSHTRTQAALPDSAIEGALAQNGQLELPQQASLFYAGRIAPNLGAFIQMTYEGASGSFGWDNAELRYAKQIGGVAGATVGVTFNNNPTSQDVWNSTPAWQMPFDQVSDGAPGPGAATQIDGALAERGVAGLTGYLWLRDSTYAEAGVYRSSPQGFSVHDAAGPLDSTAGGVIVGAAPYWRLTHERQWGNQSLSAGTYGIVATLALPDQPVGRPADRYRDVALDAQYQYIADRHILSIQTTGIWEHQTFDASVPAEAVANSTNDLRTFRLGSSYYFRRRYGAALGVFSTSGTADALLYPSEPLSGFSTNRPDSLGWTGELDYVPWHNVKLLAQYVRYQKFNGGRRNYDGAGRNASDNNTFYVLCWLAF